MAYSYCCTEPFAGLPAGAGNIDPAGISPVASLPKYMIAMFGGQFVIDAGDPPDYRLSNASPCIDAGTNLVGVVDDLAGIPRPLDGDVNDIAIADTIYPDAGCFTPRIDVFRGAAHQQNRHRQSDWQPSGKVSDRLF